MWAVCTQPAGYFLSPLYASFHHFILHTALISLLLLSMCYSDSIPITFTVLPWTTHILVGIAQYRKMELPHIPTIKYISSKRINGTVAI